MHMERVQVQLTPEQVRLLKERSAASGLSVAALVRDALAQWIDRDERAARVERALSALGGFHSGVGDLAENHDIYLNEEGRW